MQAVIVSITIIRIYNTIDINIVAIDIRYRYIIYVHLHAA